MTNTYFYLQVWVEALKKTINDSKLISIVSTDNLTLFITFKNEDNEQFVLRIFRSPTLGIYNVLTQFTINSSNQFHYLKQAWNSKITSIYTVALDRSFIIELENQSAIWIKLYGKATNVVFYDQNGFVEQFRHNRVNETKLSLPAYTSTEQLMAQLMSISWSDWIRKHPYLIQESTITDHYQNAAEGFNDALTQAHELRADPALALPFWENHQRWASTAVKNTLINQLKDQLKQEAQKSLHQAKHKAVKLEEDWEQLNAKVTYGQMADTLMANLIHYKPLSSLEINNVHTNQPITLKLNKQLTWVKQAEKWYEKEKNRKIEIDYIIDQIEKNNQLVENYTLLIEAIDATFDLKSLRKMASNLQNQKAIQRNPWRVFEYLSWEIWVGKSGTENDILLKSGTKNDLWFHARGVTGSHVLLKSRGKIPFPTDVIAYAAGLAAWYSKSKNDTLAHIQYTLLKFVRKPKRAAPGQVTLLKENTILVPPIKP